MNPERCLTLHRLLALLFFGSLMFTNCGGGGGGPSAPPSPPSFDIALDTTGLTISPGYSGTFNITLQPRNGFSGAVTVTISGFPQGVTATPASPFQLTGTTQKVTLTAASSTVTGNYAVSFQAKSGSLSASASMALQVEDLQAFFLSLASQELALDSGSSGSISFSVLNDGGALNYTLNLSVSGLPTGASGSFAKNPIAPTESGKLTIAASTNAPPSVNSPVIITATRSVD